MTREEMRARAIELREQGVVPREIAQYLSGVSTSTVYRWTTPSYIVKDADRRDRTRVARREDDRRRAMDSKVKCPHCETLHPPEYGMCRGCHAATANVRWSLIAGMWADGWAAREIAAAIGTTLGSLRVMIHRMRRDGWDVPYRYTMVDGKRVAAN